MGMKQRLFLHDKPLTGIEISQTGVKIMSINTKKWAVTGYGSIDLDPAKLQESLAKNDDYLAKSIRSLLDKNIVGKIPSDHVVLSVPTGRTYSRSLTLPKEAEKNLFEAIKLEAEQYIPVPLSELNVGYEIIKRHKDTIEVTISAAPSKLVDSLVAACDASGLTVLMAEPSINSVARLINKTEEGQLATIIVDIGAAATDVAVLDGTIRASASVNEGGNTFTLNIANKLKVPLQNAHQLKVLSGLSHGPKQTKITEALDSSLSAIVTEIQKIMRYYSERIDDKKKIEQIIIVGGGSNVPGLGDYFTQALTMPARVASPWQVLNFGKLTQPSRQFKPRYITAAGLACISPKEVWK
jgi:type IV pilus assembly protein PilM